MNALRGIIKRVIRRKGRVGRAWSLEPGILQVAPPACNEVGSRGTV